jgi:hypothetical protein
MLLWRLFIYLAAETSDFVPTTLCGDIIIIIITLGISCPQSKVLI